MLLYTIAMLIPLIIKIAIPIAVIVLGKLYIDYQIETKNKSIQGFLQYLKTKYYDKPNSR